MLQPFGSPNGPEIDVSVMRQRAIPPSLELRTEISGRSVRLTAPIDIGSRASRRIHGFAYGDSDVAVTLTADGETLARVEFTTELVRGSVHWVSAQVGQHRPLGFCIGSLATPVPLRGIETDTLFVAYGGMPKGVMC